MPLIVFEDAAVAFLEPLALTRPAFGLRCGASTLLERQLRWAGVSEAAAWVRPLLAEPTRRATPHLNVNLPVAAANGPLTLVNARWMPLATACGEAPEVGLVGDEVAFIRLAERTAAVEPGELTTLLHESRQALPSRQVGGALIRYPWDLIEHNPAALGEDARRWQAERTFQPHPRASVLGPLAAFLCHPSAQIEPHVLVDTTRGPVLVDAAASVQAFTRLEGPCHIGEGSQLYAARLRGGSIGPHCRIGGEVEASIVQGFSNKYHDGFLGHSYLGEWVNFGAGTHTSDLRNDYGTIAMSLAGRTIDTGLAKIGAYIGDHTRTSIGTLLNTGTMIGPFGMLIASGTLLPRLLPPFTRYGHGRIQERTDLGQMFSTAALALARRGQEWTAGDAEFYLALFEQTAEARRRIIRESDQRRVRRVVG